MKLKRSLIFNLALSFLVATAVFSLSEKGVLKRLELSSSDLLFRLRGTIPFNPKIMIIEISDSDISQVGRWPWKRSWHAAMCKALVGLGARMIYFDIIFSEASTEEDDRLLEEAIKASKNVYLPFVFFEDRSFKKKDAYLPIGRFSSHIKGMGALNIYPDIDGTIRSIPLVFKGEEEISTHAAFQIALDYGGLKMEDVTADHIILSDSKGKFEVPLIQSNRLLINWPGKWHDTFKHRSFLEVLAAYKDISEGKKPWINIDDFKDSLCIVGVTAVGLYDIKPIPIEPQYPGIGIIASTASNVLDRKFLYSPPRWASILILYLLSLAPSLLIQGNKPLREIILVLFIGSVYFAAVLYYFKRGIRLDSSAPLLGLITSYLVVGAYNFVRISVERQSFFKMAVTDGLTGLFNIRYFNMLIEAEIMLAKSDPAKRFVIVMSDVDHFKKFNDTYGHQVGDLVLKEVAGVVKASVRSSDVAARYGGEEMIVALRGASFEDGFKIAEKIRKNVEEHVLKDKDNTYHVTISIGVSTFKPDDKIENLVKRADDGLYKAKESGRNCIKSIERSS